MSCGSWLKERVLSRYSVNGVWLMVFPCFSVCWIDCHHYFITVGEKQAFCKNVLKTWVVIRVQEAEKVIQPGGGRGESLCSSSDFLSKNCACSCVTTDIYTYIIVHERVDLSSGLGLFDVCDGFVDRRLWVWDTWTNVIDCLIENSLNLCI